MNKALIRSGIYGALALCGVVISSAQESQQRTSEFLDTRNLDFLESAPGLAFKVDSAGQAHAPATPGDAELGDQVVLMPRGSYQPFTVRAATSGYFTDNAALTDTGELDDFYWRSSVGGTYLPSIGENLYGEITAGYEFFRYQDHSRLDFDSLEARAGVLRVFRELGDLSTWARYRFKRLTSGRGHHELFTGHTIEVGLYKPIPITDRSDAYFSYISEFSLDADPGHTQYHQHSAILGYEWLATDRCSLLGYYQASYLDYSERGRDDITQHLGLVATYDINHAVEISLSGSYTFNNSNIAGLDYEVGTLGAMLGLKMKF